MTIQTLEKLFAFGLAGQSDMTVVFRIPDEPRYALCTIDKHPDGAGGVLFFLRLPGGVNAGFTSFRDLAASPLFDGRTLQDVFENAEILSAGGSDPENRLNLFIK